MKTNQFKQPFQYEKIPLDTASFKKDDSDRPKGSSWKTIRRIWSYLAMEKGKLLLVILMVITSAGLGLLGPYLVGTAVDRFIDTKTADGLSTLLIGLILIYLFHSLALFLQNFWMVGIAQNTVFTIRESLFKQFHRLPISYFDKRQQGELMSRVTNDIDNINNTLNQSVIQIFASVITLVGTLTVMLLLSPILTAVTMTIVPLLFFAMRWITNRTGPLYKVQQKDLGDINGYVEEIVSGQHIVKTFSQEERVIREFSEKNKKLKKTGFWAMTISGFIPKVMNTLNYLSFALIALIGSILALKENPVVTIGVIVIFTEYARQFTRPLNELSNQFNVLLSAIAGAERVFQVMDEEQEESDEENAQIVNTTQGHIEFDHVSFSYEDQLTLDDISFEALPGKTVAFVGHTGAGKSTIIHLISRFYNYDNGEIRLDGTPLKDITRDSLRSHMGFVLQDAYLFQGTIKENIRYGRLDATDDEVIQAAQDANAHTFISELPQGYDTMLDQNGSGISQGQRQLITIARALIKDPSILVLDEATSNIDTITEVAIQEALARLMKGRTSFVIAHRLNTIQEADLIIMLAHGKVLESGNHDELIKARGAYYQLFNSQIKEATGTPLS